VAGHRLLVECRFFVLVDLVLVVNRLSLMLLVVDGSCFAFKVQLLPTSITVGLHQLTLRLTRLFIEFILVRLQLGHLLLQNV
jgi:hypothetical protein